MKRRRFSRTQWQQWLAEHAQSHQSVRQFCDQRNLPENSFYRWRKILNFQSPSPLTNPLVSDSQFVQLKLATTSAVEIRLPCGAVISTPAEISTLKSSLEEAVKKLAVLALATVEVPLTVANAKTANVAEATCKKFTASKCCLNWESDHDRLDARCSRPSLHRADRHAAWR